MKRLQKYEWKSYIVFTAYVFMLMIVLWIIASYINVLCHNFIGCDVWYVNYFRFLSLM